MTEEAIIDINELDIDINEIADKLFLGPQTELLEQIEGFNRMYGRYSKSDEIIKINRNFGFKPGVYDNIKEVHGNYCLGYQSKPKDIYSLHYRINNNKWRCRDFWNKAIQIQAIMKRLKNSSVFWQDNVASVDNFFGDLKERIPTEIKNTTDIFTEDVVTVGVENQDSPRDMIIIVDILTANINLEVFHQDEIIAEYLWGDVKTRWKVPFWKFLNNWIDEGPNNPHSSYISNPWAKIYPRFPKLHHPYVSRQNYNRDINWQTYTCTGDMQTDLMDAAWGLNIAALCSLTRSWLSKYHIPRTNPLNRIKTCHYGWEIGMDKKIWTHLGYSANHMMESCNWPDVYLAEDNYEGENPCDSCQFLEGYAYLEVMPTILEDAAYPGQEVIHVEPCQYAIREYETPLTDDDIIKEACIMHVVCCNEMRRIGSTSEEDTLRDFWNLDYVLTDDNRFPRDANLTKIDELNPEFNLSKAMYKQGREWPNHNVEDLLDFVFNCRVWDDLVEDYIDMLDLNAEEADDMHYDLRNDSLDTIRGYIQNAKDRHLPIDPMIDSISEVEPNNTALTAEESAIRWATQNGRTLNI